MNEKYEYTLHIDEDEILDLYNKLARTAAEICQRRANENAGKFHDPAPDGGCEVDCPACEERKMKK